MDIINYFILFNNMTDLIISDSVDTLQTYDKQYTNLHVYQGYVDTVTKLPHGKGRIKYLDLNSKIDIYEGDFNNGELSGNGTIIYRNSEIYQGQVFKSNRRGNGSLYLSNGKFQYDGLLINEIINKPIYSVNFIKNILCFQGFKIGNVYNGWCIEHDYDTGFITHISFYEDGIPIKGFQFIKTPKSLFMFAINAANCNKGIVRYMKNDEINNIIKFMNNVFEKLSKPNNLTEFLSDKNNLDMLDTISYMYIKDANLKTFDENISYLIGNEKTLIEESYNLDMLRRRYLHFENHIIVGTACADNTNKMINAEKLLKKNITDYSTTSLDIIEYGDMILLNNEWVLDGYSAFKVESKNNNKYFYRGIFEKGILISGAKYHIASKTEKIKIYEGSFNKNGQYHGTGTYYYDNSKVKNSTSDRIMYQGDFINDLRNGNGTSYYYNKDINIQAIEYIGEWSDDSKHGQGTLFDETGTEIYSGEFIDNSIA